MKASDILGMSDLKTKVVKVKEWDCEFTIRELGLEDGLKMFSMVKDAEEGLAITAEDLAQVVAWGVIDPATAERLFSDDDVASLKTKNSKPLMFLFQQIMALSGEDAEKN
jgi:hypothetical protein